ncbi:hypothetical protein ACTMU2_41080 [Cupriavidus basilensis]
MSEAITDEQIERLRAYYDANGVSPDVVAEAIVDAARTGRPLVLDWPVPRPMYHLKRISRIAGQIDDNQRCQEEAAISKPRSKTEANRNASEE